MQNLSYYYAGKMFYIWLGTLPRVVLLEPKLIREMMANKGEEFHKPEINAFTKLFVAGVSSLNGEKWAMHRKIINPAFHMEKLKVNLLPHSCNLLIIFNF